MGVGFPVVGACGEVTARAARGRCWAVAGRQHGRWRPDCRIGRPPGPV